MSLNPEPQFSPEGTKHPKRIFRHKEALADAGTPEEAQGAARLNNAPVHSNGKENVANTAFADFMVGNCLGDAAREHDAWKKLKRIALAAARKSGFLRCSCSGDYEQVALTCLDEQVRKYRQLTAYEIVQLQEANKFAYIFGALFKDFIDESRKFQRRRELAVDWDDPSSWNLLPESGEDPGSYQAIDGVQNHRDHDSIAKKLQIAADDLPEGPGAIAEGLADLICNSERLPEFTDSDLSDTACKTRFVQYVAKRREVREQVVRKNVKQFKDNSVRAEYARVLEILGHQISASSKPVPRITAPAALKPQPCPLPAEIQAQPVWTDEERNSNSWRSRCLICNTRLHNEGDYCSVCFPEDANGQLRRDTN